MDMQAEHECNMHPTALKTSNVDYFIRGPFICFIIEIPIHELCKNIN
jgi:hypothetical protein